MNQELQRAQDMLNAMQSQRDNALNSVVLAQADLAELRRQLTAKQAEADQLRAQLGAATLEQKKAAAEEGSTHPGVPVANDAESVTETSAS